MAEPNRIHDFPRSRTELGAHDAFLVTDRSAYYIVEQGHVDLFAVVENEDGHILNRRPFIARITKDKAFFGAPVLSDPAIGDGFAFVFLAVPSRGAVVVRDQRERLVGPDAFDLNAVVLIDDWVTSTSWFMAEQEVPPPRDTVLLEADPDVPYGSRSTVSAHHLEVLWVRTDRSTRLIDDPGMEVTSEVTFPLSEYLWLALPEDTRISAVHTPGIVRAGELWEALDRHSIHVLRSASRVWRVNQKREEALRSGERDYRKQVRGQLIGTLGGLLGNSVRPTGEQARATSGALQAVAAIVAEAAGAQYAEFSDSPGNGDLYDALREIVSPSGIRVRRIELSRGWEQRDGPSFVGVLPREGQRPVAVVNRGRGSFEMIDPVSGTTTPVNRNRANALDSQGVQLYPPLAHGVNTGVEALLQAVRGKGRDILGVLLMGALGAVVALLTPILTGQLLAEIIPRVDVSMWVAALGALLLGAFATAAISIVGALCLLRIEARIDETLQTAIWNRLLALPLPFFGRYLAGDLADRANGVSLIRQMLTGAASASLVSGVFSIFSFMLLFYYSTELALWTGVLVLTLAGASWFFAMRQLRHQRAALAAQGEIDGLVFQLIVGLAKIRQANVELNALQEWSRKYARQRREHLSARKWAAGQVAFNALFLPASHVLISALIWYSLIEGVDGNGFSLADFLSFNAAFGQFVVSSTGLTATLTTIVAVLPLFERVLPIIEEQPESVAGTALQHVSGRIECEYVSFRYPSATRDTLQNVSFDIRPGEYVAFLGPSGAGKSTLYRLLLGFERPIAGSVLMDGHDLLSLDLRSMRRHFGVVLQNGQLLPNDIYSIIAGDAPLSEQEALAAARAVGLDEDIEALPMGMKTVLSDSGAGLSGGQQQRLLVARALARKPRVLLFDEATSMLDNRTQDTIRTTLRGLNITRILIAHRLSTVVDTDRIYVMQDGKIVETGHYKDLMEKGGVLAEMASRQIV